MPPKIARLAGLGAFGACAGFVALYALMIFVSRHTALGGMTSGLAWVTWISLGIVFAALYVLWVYQRVFTGPLRGAAVVGDGPGAASAATMAGTDDGADGSWARRTTARFGDLTRGEIAVMTPLVALILVLGFFPGPVLEVLEPAVAATMAEVGAADPVTPNPASINGVPR